METPNEIKDIKYTNSKKRKKKFLRKYKTKDALSFLKKNTRYITAGVLFVLMVVVAVFLGEKNDGSETVDVDVSVNVSQSEVSGFEVNAYPEVNELLQNYHNAYAAGDLAALQSIATPFSENELGYISVLSQYVESYQNMVFYTKPGMDAKSYMVNVYLEVKFEGVETLAPGFAFFYVRTNEDGSLYIDNLYSLYNLENKNNPLDTNIYNLILEHQKQEELAVLLNDAQVKFNAAMEADANLATMVNETVPNAISEWIVTVLESVTDNTEIPSTEGTEITETESTETGNSETESSETESSESTEQESGVISFPEGTVITIEKAINVRKEMTTNSDIVETLYKGERVTVVMSYAEGWTKVEWDNKTGYIRSDLLQ